MLTVRPFVALLLGLWLLAVTGTVPGQSREPVGNRLPTIGDAASASMSIAQERALAVDLIRQIRWQLPLTDDLEVQGYLQTLGERLLGHAEGPDFEYRFFAIDNTAINAFALPGGQLGFNTGLILRARNEHELASVVAHEIAHVTQRHIARQLDLQRSGGLRTAGLILMAILVATQDAEAGSAAAHIGLAASIQDQLSYSREHEREADLTGLELMARAGFDPRGMADFFERLQQAFQYREDPPEYLSTHPLTGNRLTEARTRGQQLRTEVQRESPLFALMQARLLIGRAESNDAARRHFQARIDAGANDPASRYGLAATLIEAGEPAAAIALLDALIEEHGDLSPYYVGLGRAHMRAGEFDRALGVFSLALQLFPANRAIIQYHAEALRDAGRLEEARGLLNRHRQLIADEPTLLRTLAQINAELGNRDESRMNMAEYYQLHGQFSLAIRQLDQIIDASDASIHNRSRAVSRRSALIEMRGEGSR
jgi:beta-barrel assembly-enhancing protease